MAKSAYIGVSSKAKKVKKMYFGVGDKAKKVKKAYIGDANGKAKLFYAAGGVFFGDGGKAYPYEYDSSSETLTSFTTLPAMGARCTTVQYSKGKWIWASGRLNDESTRIYVYFMDEKTHEVTTIDVTASTNYYGTVRGVAVDDNNVYMLITNASSGGPYFVTISLSDYSCSSVQIPYSSFGPGGRGAPYESAMVRLPDGKFIMIGGGNDYTYLLVYDKTNNTLTSLSSTIRPRRLYDRTVNSGKVVFATNSNYYIGVTDGVNITTWNDSTGNAGAYNSAAATYGNGMFLLIGANAVYKSTDGGSTWSRITPTVYAGAVTYGDGLFIRADQRNAKLYSSIDGSSWTELGGLTISSNYYMVLAYNDLGGVGK